MGNISGGNLGEIPKKSLNKFLNDFLDFFLTTGKVSEFVFEGFSQRNPFWPTFPGSA